MEYIYLGLLIGLGIYLAPVALAFFVVINPSYKEQDPMWYDEEPKQSILSSYIV